MAKPNRNQQVAATPARKVRIVASKMFTSTLKNFRGDAQVIAAIQAFVAAKRNDPTAPFGSKDYPFRGASLKGYLHAGLTFDAQIVYTISGRDPHTIRLYGVFTHDDLGTGNPAQMKRQQKAGQTFDNTRDFTPLDPKLDESQQEVNMALLEEFLALSK